MRQLIRIGDNAWLIVSVLYEQAQQCCMTCTSSPVGESLALMGSQTNLTTGLGITASLRVLPCVVCTPAERLSTGRSADWVVLGSDKSFLVAAVDSVMSAICTIDHGAVLRHCLQVHAHCV
jgi:hypothetical protein